MFEPVQHRRSKGEDLNDIASDQSQPSADATPAKRFFIYMLVKDIELIPAVVDLVDNSVDAARVRANSLREQREIEEAGDTTASADEIVATPDLASRPVDDQELSGFSVEVHVAPDLFRISDNCGGIRLDMAERYAFRFGRPEDFPGSPLAVGQFGVGMKRALFKLGTHFTVSSIADDSRFVLPVDVDQWARDPDPYWRFVFSETDPSYSPTADEARGTTIEVDRLHESVSEDFGSDAVLGRLRIDLELRHQSALKAGMTIDLNDATLRPSRPELALSNDISPVHVRETLTVPEGSVSMELFAGVIRSGEDEGTDDLEAEDFQTVPPSGWYLFCNNRLLLVADRSELTGWGDGANAYHPQYRNFRGYVYLDGDSSLLPWNTTKTSVDRDSRIFRMTRAHMVSALRSVQTFINQAKSEAQRLPIEDRVLATAIASTRSSLLSDLPISDVMRYPTAPKRRAESAIRRIAYAVPREDFDRVAEALETESASEVGRRTFEHFLETQVDG